MTDRPIIFSGPMVRTILSGQKSQTRRIVKPQPIEYAGGISPHHKAKHPAPYIDAYCGEKKTTSNPRGMGMEWCWWTEDDRQGPFVGTCPYGHPGDRLWVRETWCLGDSNQNGLKISRYAAEDDQRYWRVPSTEDFLKLSVRARSGAWIPSIHMPRWASRITLEITEIRVQRLQDISEDDAIAEGIPQNSGGCFYPPGMDGSGQAAPNPQSTARSAYGLLWDSIHGHGSWDANPWVWCVTSYALNHDISIRHREDGY